MYNIIMSKREKLIERFLKKPKDFTWEELIKLLNSFNYKEISAGKTGGSRARFINKDHPPIILHKPHPGLILKRYQLDEIIDMLVQEKLL